jgi:hypothetical protein
MGGAITTFGICAAMGIIMGMAYWGIMAGMEP